ELRLHAVESLFTLVAELVGTLVSVHVHVDIAVAVGRRVTGGAAIVGRVRSVHAGVRGVQSGDGGGRSRGRSRVRPGDVHETTGSDTHFSSPSGSRVARAGPALAAGKFGSGDARSDAVRDAKAGLLRADPAV